MIRWHHRLNRHESEQTLGGSEGQGSLVWCSPSAWGESDTAQQLSNNNRNGEQHSVCHCCLNDSQSKSLEQKQQTLQLGQGNRSTQVLDTNHELTQLVKPECAGDGEKQDRLVLSCPRSFFTLLVRGRDKDPRVKIFTLNPSSCHFNSNFTEFEPFLPGKSRRILRFLK